MNKKWLDQERADAIDRLRVELDEARCALAEAGRRHAAGDAEGVRLLLCDSDAARHAYELRRNECSERDRLAALLEAEVPTYRELIEAEAARDRYRALLLRVVDDSCTPLEEPLQPGLIAKIKQELR